MQRACDLIRERHKIDFNLQNIPIDDPETFEFIGKGHTAGVFQLEGSGMTRYIMQMKPTNVANVIAMVALFRPGPMDFIPTYIRRMHGEEEVSYRHPALEPIMKETYGIAIYQEQVMFAAMDLAGYTASEADELRKAISKKKADAIAKHRLKFIAGAVKNNIPEDTAADIFTDWENFARYGFNKSHAADYGIISVRTAYLKTHYTVEYHDRGSFGFEKRYRKGGRIRRRLPLDGHRRASAQRQFQQVGFHRGRPALKARPPSASGLGRGQERRQRPGGSDSSKAAKTFAFSKT